MSGPPPPPRNKNKLVPNNMKNQRHDEEYEQQMTPTGSGYNVARQRNTSDSYEAEKVLVDDNFPNSLLEQIPETTLGMNVNVRGELEFETLLRIDGDFTGRLISRGNLIIGPHGKVVGNIVDMNSVLVDGKVVGDINVQRLCLRGQSSVFGNITCKSLQIDPTVIIVGNLNVHPLAPKSIDHDGKVISDAAANKKPTQPIPKDINPVSSSDSTISQSHSGSGAKLTTTSRPGSSSGIALSGNGSNKQLHKEKEEREKEEEKRRVEEEKRKKDLEDAKKLQEQQDEEAKRRKEEARRKAHEDEEKKKEEEKKRKEEQARRKAKEEEEIRKQKEEDAKRKAQEIEEAQQEAKELETSEQDGEGDTNVKEGDT